MCVSVLDSYGGGGGGGSGGGHPLAWLTTSRGALRAAWDPANARYSFKHFNDDLVDLDKEFTIVVNGKAIKETRRRSFVEMKSRMLERNDWDYIFPVRYVTSVPKE